MNKNDWNFAGEFEIDLGADPLARRILGVDVPLSHTDCKKKEKSTMTEASIKNVIFNPPATIVFWSDGTKTAVKCSEKDIFDPEKGIAMAIAKRCGGNKSDYYKEIRRWIEKSWKNYPSRSCTETSSVENSTLKKYISQAQSDYAAVIDAAVKGNPAEFMREMGRVSADLAMLELEINK